MSKNNGKQSNNGKTIWIDLDNSPHVLFFHPIIRELKKRNYRVVVSARDYAQTIALADLFNLEYTKIGRHYGKNVLMKIVGLLVRSAQTLPIIIREKPTLALSHGSRSQIITSKLMGIPVAMAFDYEHTQMFPFITLDLALVPEILTTRESEKKVKETWGYPGIKEDVYVQDLVPDASIYKTLGINEANVIATIRPPATTAHYHTAKSDELFEAVINHLGSQENTVMVMLPRTEEQAAIIKEKWPAHFETDRIIIPKETVHGLNLLWHSDLAISGGGTIIREAAALGVPAYSIFGGRAGAVDEDLEREGRLKLVKSADEVNTEILVEKKSQPNRSQGDNSVTLDAIVNKIAAYTSGLG